MVTDGSEIAFIVGSPRSGTTWLQRLLAAHPRVCSGQESDLFDIYIGPLLRHWRTAAREENRGGVGLACYMTEDRFMEILGTFFDSLLSEMLALSDIGQLFVEKTPSHALFMQEIHELLPRAKFIHVLRDPRDVVASLLFASRSWGSEWAPRHPRDAMKEWCQHVVAARDAAFVIPESQFFEVRYEHLLRDPASSLDACARYLDLDWDVASVEAAVQENGFDKLKDGSGGTSLEISGEVVRQRGQSDREPTGFYRQGSAGSWRQNLSLRERCWIYAVGHHCMSRMGYRWRTFPF